MDYKFMPDARLEPRDFVVALTVFYQDTKGQYYSNTFFNQTVEIIEIKKMIDWELLSMLAIVFGLIAGVGESAWGLHGCHAVTLHAARCGIGMGSGILHEHLHAEGRVPLHATPCIAIRICLMRLFAGPTSCTVILHSLCLEEQYLHLRHAWSLKCHLNMAHLAQSTSSSSSARRSWRLPARARSQRSPRRRGQRTTPRSGSRAPIMRRSRRRGRQQRSARWPSRVPCRLGVLHRTSGGSP